MLRLFVWRVGSQDFAMPVAGVMRVVRAVAITNAPDAPPFGCGAINVRGKLVPIFDLRERFGLLKRALDPADHFILIGTPHRMVALWVDTAHGVVEYDDDSVMPEQTTDSGSDLIADVVELKGGLLLLPELEHCLCAGHLRIPGGRSPEAVR